MKKAKILLAAITVIAVVGGALAFKAKSLSLGKPLYTTVLDPVGGTITCSIFTTKVFADGAIPVVGTIYEGSGIQGRSITDLEAANQSCTYNVNVDLEAN